MEGEYFTCFGWDEPETRGVLGIVEENNQFISIAMSKNDNEKPKEE